MIDQKNRTRFVVERQDAEDIDFGENRNYPVTEEFNPDAMLGTARVALEDGELVAYAAVTREAAGYPAVMFQTRSDKTMKLLGIGISQKQNVDETIEKVKLVPMNVKPKKGKK